MNRLSYRIPSKFKIDGERVPNIRNIKYIDVVKVNESPLVSDKNDTVNLEQDIEFQILDWRQCQEDDDNDCKKFVVKLFGRTRNNDTIYVKVNKFEPYFYVEIDKNLRQRQIDQLIDGVKNKIFPKEFASGLSKVERVSKHKFYGFTNYEKFDFLQLTFNNQDAMRKYENAFSKPLRIFGISKEEIKYNIYESNMEPFLRCMHIRNLDSVGWVRIPTGKYKLKKYVDTYSNINIKAD